MAGYRIESIASLAKQMTFAGLSVRADQVNNAEALLHDLNPNKAYPLDYLVFRITGYHPKSESSAADGAGEELLTGLVLQHDIGRLIEEVSDSLDIPTSSLPDPVLTIEDLTEKFNVTSKTIQRWRRRGLPARRFIFPDGKRRVGFLMRSVDLFVSLHSEEVNSATNFTQLTEPERLDIASRARRLAMSCQCCMHEIARRIAKKMRRSHLTILHTIRKHDIDHPELAIFPLAASPVADLERSKIVRGFRRGMPLGLLARRTCRPRSVVYRVIVEERVARVTARKLKFIDDPLYHQPDAGAVVDAIVKAEDLAAPRTSDDRVPRDLPPYFQALYRTPLLTPGREKALFLKFNFHKFQFVTVRREMDPNSVRARDIASMERYLKLATETKNAIVAANLRLVVSIARRHLRPGLNIMELVSDGNVTLMRAVESFDFHKGNKFSTYATLALMKGFARSVPMMQASKRRAGAGEEMLTTIADRHPSESAGRLAVHDELRTLLARLDPTERAVLLSHFGLDSSSDSLRGLAPSASQLQTTLSLSRQRLRQIERRAMDKLRAAANLMR
jgi:RNA polymerase primary sigma factor